MKIGGRSKGKSITFLAASCQPGITLFTTSEKRKNTLIKKAKKLNLGNPKIEVI